MLRKSFDFDYYYKNNSESTGDNYRDHICTFSDFLCEDGTDAPKITASMTSGRISCVRATLPLFLFTGTHTWNGR
jgi:hypothetical protein